MTTLRTSKIKMKKTIMWATEKSHGWWAESNVVIRKKITGNSSIENR